METLSIEIPSLNRFPLAKVSSGSARLDSHKPRLMRPYSLIVLNGITPPSGGCTRALGSLHPSIRGSTHCTIQGCKRVAEISPGKGRPGPKPFCKHCCKGHRGGSGAKLPRSIRGATSRCGNQGEYSIGERLLRARLDAGSKNVTAIDTWNSEGGGTATAENSVNAKRSPAFISKTRTTALGCVPSSPRSDKDPSRVPSIEVSRR